MIEHCKPDDPDKDLPHLFQSVISLVDIKCFNTLREHPECKDTKMKKIYNVMNDAMLVRHPIHLRRVDFAAICLTDGEDQGAFLRRIITAAGAADMANCLMETQILLKFYQALNKTELNKLMLSCAKLSA